MRITFTILLAAISFNSFASTDTAQFICKLKHNYIDPNELHSFSVSGSQFTSSGYTQPVNITKPLTLDSNDNVMLEFDYSMYLGGDSGKGSVLNYWQYNIDNKSLTMKVVMLDQYKNVVSSGTSSTLYEECQTNINTRDISIINSFNMK